MAFRDHYYKIKDKILEDKKFLSEYPYLDINTSEMEDEEAIKRSVRIFLDYTRLETQDSYKTRDEMLAYGWDPKFWYIYHNKMHKAGDKTIYLLKRDYIFFPYFLGTRLQLDIHQFSDLIIDEPSDSWVWPVLMQFINGQIADGVLAYKGIFIDSLISGQYFDNGGLATPPLSHLTSEDIFKKYYRPPFLFSNSDSPAKLDQARNTMFKEMHACMKNCEAIIEFLDFRKLTSNDIYLEMNELKNKIAANLDLASNANAFQLHAYFSEFEFFPTYKTKEVGYGDPSTYITRDYIYSGIYTITLKNLYHNVKSNCMFEITQPTRERDDFKYESVIGRNTSDWGSRAWIADTFTRTNFSRRKFDLTADFPILRAFTPYLLHFHCSYEKNVGAEIPKRSGGAAEDKDMFALQVIDHITDTSDIKAEAQKNFPVALLKVIEIMKYPTRLLSNMVMNKLTKKFKMLYIILKINSFFSKNEKTLKVLNTVSNLKNMTPLWAAFQLILYSEKATHPFFKTGRLMMCEELPLSVSLFLPLLELILSEILDEMDMNISWISIDHDEARLIKKYLSCKILKDIL